ncbi:MAG: hypothetical protein K0U47_11970 [Epsilonproteobacteria bacterium]|nr:hypothetical protein [Campylobacterota bacterium]
MKTYNIPFSKTKLFFLGLLTAILTLASIGLFLEEYYFGKVFGLLGFLLFGYGLYLIIVRYFTKSPGLIISTEGITNNMYYQKLTMIPWSDITHITTEESGFQRIITIHVKNPHIYIAKNNPFNQLLSRINCAFAQTPIILTTTTLKIDFDSLLQVVEQAFAEAKKQY